MPQDNCRHAVILTTHAVVLSKKKGATNQEMLFLCQVSTPSATPCS